MGRNPRCDNCMAHCGFEGTAVDDTFAHPLKALKAALRGPRSRGPMAPDLPILYATGDRHPQRVAMPLSALQAPDGMRQKAHGQRSCSDRESCRAGAAATRAAA